MKLLYAIASALFCVAAPVAAPAQSLDLSLMSALCSDDYYEDTAGQCGAVSAWEVFTIEAILAKYGIVITGDIDEDVIVLFLDDLVDTSVDSIQPGTKTQSQPTRNPTPSLPTSRKQSASKVATVQPPLEIGGEAADDVATTGPTARSVPAAAEAVHDRTIE